ncbi:transforming acidic coiled-coil-containing protein 3-like [Oncorhynchus keta]|uniref:transforming acidic coiled-coil-containing protein 3-like n=1 Tax=Oncorhynchus keta TaxID=8018 RepID=UPI00227C87DB|nr:transforming acidic coiled-coil-containing protein 3-like [Oncorhynchus keta]
MGCSPAHGQTGMLSRQLVDGMLSLYGMLSPPELSVDGMLSQLSVDGMLSSTALAQLSVILGKYSVPPQLSVILGVPPTQVHQYSGLGCIDVSPVLEPLAFVLPKRETVTPVGEDLSVELDGLTTADLPPILPVDNLGLPVPEPIAGPEPIEEDPMVSSTISTEFVSETGLTSDPELEAILNDPNPVLDDAERPRADGHREVQEDPELEAILNPPKPVLTDPEHNPVLEPVLTAPEHNPVPELDSEPSEPEVNPEVAESYPQECWQGKLPIALN